MFIKIKLAIINKKSTINFSRKSVSAEILRVDFFGHRLPLSPRPEWRRYAPVRNKKLRTGIRRHCRMQRPPPKGCFGLLTVPPSAGSAGNFSGKTEPRKGIQRGLIFDRREVPQDSPCGKLPDAENNMCRERCVPGL